MNGTKINKISYKGHHIFYNEQTVTDGSKRIYKEYVCPICNKPLQSGDTIYVVITSDEESSFPNVRIHKDCTNNNNDFEATTNLLVFYHEKFKRCLENHRGWQNGEFWQAQRGEYVTRDEGTLD